jgi:hypothetical protein
MSLIGQTGLNQNKFTIYGHISDQNTGENLIGAAITILELPFTGTYSNAYGFYSLTIPEGNYTISVQFIGYEQSAGKILLNSNLKRDFNLLPKPIEQNEVVITGEKKNDVISGTRMGVNKLSSRELETIPALLGERDALKTIQLLPGIKPAGEGNTGIFVRGGTPDQNLILLDEAPVYNASHLLGFFSIFNSDAVKDVTVFKGEMPAEYGGRLSSVLDIKMRDGNDKKFDVNGGIGLIASHLSVEGPIVKDQGSFIISARRTYVDMFLKLSKDTTINQSRIYFYDLNAKANYKIDENNRIYLSGYFGKDVLGLGSSFGTEWGNVTGTVRWNHLFNDKLFSNSSLTYSRYDCKINIDLSGIQRNIFSRIEDISLKQDFQFYANTTHTFKFGFNSGYYSIIPGLITAQSSLPDLSLLKRYAWENALYASDELRFSNTISFEYGIRLSSFSVLGPGTFYSINSSGTITDTLIYQSGKFVKPYFNAEPRLAVNYQLDESSSLKLSYSRNTQNLHLLSNSISGNPTDLWISNSNLVKPETADQVSFGYFRNFNDNLFELSAEVYYKYLQNQIDYRDGTDFVLNENIESQLLFGNGRAYGVELFIGKKYGRFSGWIGYTFARTERRFDQINNGDYYPARQDRTHDISIVGIYQLSEKWTASGTWIYYTGSAVTFPSGKYYISGWGYVNYYTERNGYRMPPYHRLDIAFNWKGINSEWIFSVYNLYARENAYSITFRPVKNNPSQIEAVRTSLFSIVPAVTYNFYF